jgi:hypothetical protein
VFDRTYVTRGDSHISASITEKRAPTDESVKLLGEMERAAKDRVIQSLRIESCGVEAVIHRHDNPMDAKTHFIIVYKVNGNQRQCRVMVDWDSEIQDKLDTVWKALADDLAAYLMNGIAKTVIGR